MTGTNDDGNTPFYRRDRRLNERLAFLITEAIGFAEHAEYRDAVDVEPDHEFDHALPRSEVETFVVIEWRRQNRDNT